MDSEISENSVKSESSDENSKDNSEQNKQIANGVNILAQKLQGLFAKWILEEKLNVPSIPTVIAEAMQLASQPDATVSDIGKLIERDQSVTGRLMQIANSPLLRRARDATNIKEAMVRVGQHDLRQTLFSLFIETRLFRSEEYNELISTLWRHSLACGSMARRIAKHTGVDPDLAFVAGLVHDAGKAALLANVSQNMNDDFHFPEDILIKAMDRPHGSAGGIAAIKWNMAADIVEAISLHHHPEKASKNPLLVKTIYAADLIVYKYGIGITKKIKDGQTTSHDPLFAKHIAISNKNLLEDIHFQELGLTEKVLAEIEDNIDLIEMEISSGFSGKSTISKPKSLDDDLPEVKSVAKSKPKSTQKSTVFEKEDMPLMMVYGISIFIAGLFFGWILRGLS